VLGLLALGGLLNLPSGPVVGLIVHLLGLPGCPFDPGTRRGRSVSGIAATSQALPHRLAEGQVSSRLVASIRAAWAWGAALPAARRWEQGPQGQQQAVRRWGRVSPVPAPAPSLRGRRCSNLAPRLRAAACEAWVGRPLITAPDVATCASRRWPQPSACRLASGAPAGLHRQLNAGNSGQWGATGRGRPPGRNCLRSRAAGSTALDRPGQQGARASLSCSARSARRWGSRPPPCFRFENWERPRPRSQEHSCRAGCRGACLHSSYARRLC